MITHKSSLLELCTLWAGEQHPPGHGGAHAQQVGGAGGRHVSIIAWHQTSTGEHIGTICLKKRILSIFVTELTYFHLYIKVPKQKLVVATLPHVSKTQLKRHEEHI